MVAMDKIYMGSKIPDSLLVDGEQRRQEKLKECSAVIFPAESSTSGVAPD